MKKLSIKLRVTLWFTLLMLLLAGLVLGLLIGMSEYIVNNGSRDALISIVLDGRDQIEYDDGRLEIDDDLDYFNNGVFLSVYNEEGGLLYGRRPSTFTDPPTFVDGMVQTLPNGANAWYVYDVLCPVAHYGNVWIRGVLSSTGTGDMFHTMLRLALIFLPFFVLFAGVGGYFLIDRAFRPVRQITRTAEQIGGGTDLSRRIALGENAARKDELYALASTFDRMFARLQASFENEKRFTSDASHELRTPTAVIRAQCEYALEAARTLPEAQAALKSILEQTERMSTLIAQLLALSRADGELLTLQLEQVDLSELTELVAAESAERCAEKGIVLRTDIQPGLLLYGDETLLMRMLLNLTENGVKYGKANGSLTVRLYAKGRDVVGEIADDGMGIAPEHLARIWERFYRADPARSATEGAGLGLPMVKYIVQAHGGSVSAESTPGRGSCFRFVLPTAKQ